MTKKSEKTKINSLKIPTRLKISKRPKGQRRPKRHKILKIPKRLERLKKDHKNA